MKSGKVYLVGAGPGDPDLITVKGLDCIKKADVIIYDYLIDETLLDSTCPDVERIYAGKSSKCHAKEQDEINQLMLEKSRQGKIVVRLKGGDPFVLGRGGEEAEFLAQHKVPFGIVPGVSSATAVPAYAGIPLTHRCLASSLAVVTGHEDPSKETRSIAWEKLAIGVDTLVVLMGVHNLTHIVEQLIKNGRSPSTPVALIRHGTKQEQQTIVGNLENIIAKASEVNFEPPAVIVVGEVVRIREQLRWFDAQPLFGKRILVTRARHQAGLLSKLLREHGALPVEMPVIRIQPTASTKKLDQAIRNLEKYHWIIFTSSNGVEVFFQRLHSLNLDACCLKGIRIGAIGPATAKALEIRGIHVDYIPAEYTGKGIASGLGGQDIAGCRILLPRSAISDRELPQTLAQLGAEVHELAIYDAILAAEAVSLGKQMLLANEIDVITFTSPSTVVNLLTLLDGRREVIDRAKVACIGPKTASKAAKAGLRIDIIAQESTIPGLVEAVEGYFQRDRKEVE
ncbi:MAG: uroporphyrinogen-III C-methyltransferase [Dehalococcoidia bacterium]|nr:uroporphyrinogen-III C-methyltransferase [Dehalococcoidia bacterium]